MQAWKHERESWTCSTVQVSSDEAQALSVQASPANLAFEGVRSRRRCHIASYPMGNQQNTLGSYPQRQGAVPPLRTRLPRLRHRPPRWRGDEANLRRQAHAPHARHTRSTSPPTPLRAIGAVTAHGARGTRLRHPSTRPSHASCSSPTGRRRPATLPMTATHRQSDDDVQDTPTHNPEADAPRAVPTPIRRHCCAPVAGMLALPVCNYPRMLQTIPGSS